MVGFIGVHGDNIEMLFVHNDYRGKGIGKRLVLHAMRELHVCKVDVNEQNAQAAGFYERMGFRTRAKSALDNEGKPYPILHMQIS